MPGRLGQKSVTFYVISLQYLLQGLNQYYSRAPRSPALRPLCSAENLWDASCSDGIKLHGTLAQAIRGIRVKTVTIQNIIDGLKIILEHLLGYCGYTALLRCSSRAGYGRTRRRFSQNCLTTHKHWLTICLRQNLAQKVRALIGDF